MIIDGKKIAEKIKNQITQEIFKLKTRPNLAIILVGDREDSKLYVSLKEQEAKKVGIDIHLYKCAKNIQEKNILEIIHYLNYDKCIDAILVQLPLPDKFNTKKIIKVINPIKDVDRFHPDNLKILFQTCNHSHIMPPVFTSILEILKNIKYNLKNKQICILSNSDIFGKSLAKVLEYKNGIVQTLYADDKNLSNKTRQADLLITAIGKPKFIKKNMIKDNAVIIDIGIVKNKITNKICGDVDFENVKNKVKYITPVPGGVGPITIAMLFKNVLELHKVVKVHKVCKIESL